MSELHELEQRWDDGAAHDAMYVILSLPEKKGHRWDTDAFFASGHHEIASVRGYIDGLALARPYRRALDFGCGIGRLTQALADHFERVDGVDISATMVEQARTLNQHGDRCEYHHNPASDLRLFADASFDFVYSNIVLQHVPAELSRVYIAELVRVLMPGGLLLFQLPSGPAPVTAGGSEAGSAQPLGASAFAAAVTTEPTSIRGASGTVVDVRVSITNRGDEVWPARGAADGAGEIRLGNHWLAADGTVLLFDDERVGLPGAVAPGQPVEVTLAVTLPDQPGEYLLELDLVQETVAWFAGHGSSPARVPVVVETATGAAADPGDFKVWQPDCLEVHAVARDEVINLLESSGAQVLDITDDTSAGPAWVGYRYAATKADR